VTIDEMPPVMRELFKMLPPPGTEWPMVERIRWVNAFEAVCRVIFKDDVCLKVAMPIRGEPDTMSRS